VTAPPATPTTVPDIPAAPAHLAPVNNKPAFSNTTKFYNNWNMCFSCGWDVPSWHTGQTCNMPGTYHQVGCTCENAQAYMTAGHRVSKKGTHKTVLPVNPGPNQA
jgi:hypothetical protein